MHRVLVGYTVKLGIEGQAFVRQCILPMSREWHKKQTAND